MDKTLEVLNQMTTAGVISRYAIGGAVAAVFYVEPINTHDLDIFFHVKESSVGLDVLAPIYTYLHGLGYSANMEAIEIEGWPVQFLPIFNSLIEEAVESANTVQFNNTETRVITAEHLIAIMLQTGRPKDYARVHQFLEQGVFDQEVLNDILNRHGLKERWIEVTRRA